MTAAQLTPDGAPEHHEATVVLDLLDGEPEGLQILGNTRPGYTCSAKPPSPTNATAAHYASAAPRPGLAGSSPSARTTTSKPPPDTEPPPTPTVTAHQG